MRKVRTINFYLNAVLTSCRPNRVRDGEEGSLRSLVAEERMTTMAYGLSLVHQMLLTYSPSLLARKQRLKIRRT